jgi:hypothetical protein
VRYGFVSRLLPGHVDSPFAFALMTILCLRLRLDHGEMEMAARVSPQRHHAILVVQGLMCVVDHPAVGLEPRRKGNGVHVPLSERWSHAYSHPYLNARPSHFTHRRANQLSSGRGLP